MVKHLNIGLLIETPYSRFSVLQLYFNGFNMGLSLGKRPATPAVGNTPDEALEPHKLV
jgi:hypothetical protein